MLLFVCSLFVLTAAEVISSNIAVGANIAFPAYPAGCTVCGASCSTTKNPFGVCNAKLKCVIRKTTPPNCGGGGGGSHAGVCPVATGIGSCIVTCSGDSACPSNQKCCSNGCGYTCVTPSGGGGVTHPGSCPAPSGFLGACIIACQGDGSCPYNQKCCSNGCGMTCVSPAGSGGGTHPGTCPVHNGPGPCIVSCTGDDSCAANQKCCSNGCGRQCMTPTGGCVALPCAYPGPCVWPSVLQTPTGPDGCPLCPKCVAPGGGGTCSVDSDCTNGFCWNGGCQSYSGVGGPCNGFILPPRRCAAGLYCNMSPIPDVGGTCQTTQG